MKDPYTLSIEITIALSKICLRRISLSVFTIEVFRISLLSYSKRSETFPITSNIFPTTVLTYNLRSQTDFFWFKLPKIWFKLIKIFCIESLEHDTYRNEKLFEC